MQRLTLAFLLIGAFMLGTAAGVVGILWATGGNSTPSRDINEVAPTLSLDGPTPTPLLEVQVATELANIYTNIDSLATQVADIASGAIIAPASVNDGSTETTAEAETSDAPTAPTVERALFRIAQDDSTVRFRINEVLVGNPTEVVGSTSQIAGDIIVNFSNPAQSQIGEIAINARTLRTDNDIRNQSIRGQILQTNSNEFITFVPTALQNLPAESVSPGETLEFQIVGDLTIRGMTNAVTFDASVTLVDASRIEGFASTTVRYADFGITINSPPSVSGIGDEVILEIDFVALEVQE